MLLVIREADIIAPFLLASVCNAPSNLTPYLLTFVIAILLGLPPAAGGIHTRVWLDHDWLVVLCRSPECPTQPASTPRQAKSGSRERRWGTIQMVPNRLTVHTV